MVRKARLRCPRHAPNFTRMYELYYWPGIQGRGEFVRLALEQAGARYRDIAKDEDGSAEVMRFMHGPDVTTPAFAPPYLKHGKVVLGQTAAILLYLGPRLRLAPKSYAGQLWTHQIQLTIADFIHEAHDVHHPIAVSLYYADQKREAARRAADFRKTRAPKFLGWLESVIARNPAESGWLVGKSLTYADLSLFQTVRWLEYGFPKLTKRLAKKYPRTWKLAERVGTQKRIAAYLASDRRLAFNDDDLIRHYPELDG